MKRFETKKRIKVINFLLIILMCFSAAFSQVKQAASKNHNIKIDKNSDSATDSTIGWTWLNETSLTGDGAIFIGGRFDGRGAFFKIINGNLQYKKLSFIYEIRHIFFLNTQIGWITDNSFLYKTVDGGETWIKVSPLSITTQGAMFFLEEDSGWITDMDGAIRKIQDSDKLSRLTAAADRTVKKIQFTTANDGWLNAYGSKDSGFRVTRDGGKKWTEIDKKDARYIADFRFINGSNYGYYLNSDDQVYFTETIGESWNLLKTPKGEINDVFFLNKNIGWTIGKNMCRTLNGGEKWECWDSPKVSRYEIIFSDLDNGWLITFDNIYSTVDGGRTWQKKLHIEGY